MDIPWCNKWLPYIIQFYLTIIHLLHPLTSSSFFSDSNLIAYIIIQQFKHSIISSLVKAVSLYLNTWVSRHSFMFTQKCMIFIYEYLEAVLLGLDTILAGSRHSCTSMKKCMYVGMKCRHSKTIVIVFLGLLECVHKKQEKT